MKLYVKEYNEGKNRVVVVVTPKTGHGAMDHDTNAKALLAFLKERVHMTTLQAFGVLINRTIPHRHFQITMHEAYDDIFPEPKKPKFTDVSIDPDLLKVIKTHCPQAIKE